MDSRPTFLQELEEKLDELRESEKQTYCSSEYYKRAHYQIQLLEELIASIKSRL